MRREVACQAAEHRVVGTHLTLGDDALPAKRVGVEPALNVLARVSRDEDECACRICERARQQEALALRKKFAMLGAVLVTRRHVVAVSVENCENRHSASVVLTPDKAQTIGSTSTGEEGKRDVSQSWQLGSRYVLERRIGAGAMGQVWAGRDVDGHPLAFKLLRPEMADDPTVVARFLQERNLLVGLRSPNVIRVHDLVVEGPRLAIVMDYIAGPSLRGLLQQRGNLPPAEVASLGSRIANGLAAVHAAGILHRDLKPENVLLATDGDALEPKLADFGIASLAVTHTGHVGTANVIGTPQYLAPELGDGLPSGRASDLYALGITLYEMACGVVPFTSEAPVALLRMHADHAPGRPDGVPDELWHLIAALLAKNPQERPDDAGAVAAQLADLAPRLTGLATPPALRTPPPSRLIAAPLPASGASEFSGATSDIDGSPHRRSISVGVGLVVGLCLVALVAWLLLRDAGDAAPSSRATTTSAAVPSTAAPSSTSSKQPSPSEAALRSALSSGDAEKMSAVIGGRRFDDAVVTRRLTPPLCTSTVSFALDGRFTRFTAVAGYDESASASDTAGEIVARLDGDSRRTASFTAERPAQLNFDVTGVRTLTLEMSAADCSEATPSTLALGGGKLRR